MNYKKIIIIIFLSSFIFSSEIWEKEIPPSSYLKSFSIKSENSNNKFLKYISYSSLFLGTVIGSNENASVEAEFLGDIFLLGGVIPNT